MSDSRRTACFVMDTWPDPASPAHAFLEKAREAAKEWDVTVLLARGEKPEDAEFHVILLDAHAIETVYMSAPVTTSYRIYWYLKTAEFDAIHLMDWQGMGYYTLLAKVQGLAFQDLSITVHSIASALEEAKKHAIHISSLDFLHMDFMEKQSRTLVEENYKKKAQAKPLVSVCIIHYNRPHFLKLAVESIQAQDYTNFEVIVVDDGSTSQEAITFLDELEEQCKPKGWQVIRQPNAYLGAARNTGAKLAKGKYLLFMDDDNYAKPAELSTFVKIAEQSGADILTSVMECFTEDDSRFPISTGRIMAPLGGAMAAGLYQNCFGDANALIKREVFEALGGFTEDYGVGFEDWEFFGKAVLKGYGMEVVPEPLFFYREGKDRMSQTTPALQNHWRSLRPYLETLPTMPEAILMAQGFYLQDITNHQKLTELHRVVHERDLAHQKLYEQQQTLEKDYQRISLQRDNLEAKRHVLESEAKTLKMSVEELAERLSQSNLERMKLKHLVDATGQDVIAMVRIWKRFALSRFALRCATSATLRLRQLVWFARSRRAR